MHGVLSTGHGHGYGHGSDIRRLPNAGAISQGLPGVVGSYSTVLGLRMYVPMYIIHPACIYVFSDLRGVLRLR